MAGDYPRGRGHSNGVDRFVARCRAALQTLYLSTWSPDEFNYDAAHASALKQVMRMLAVLLAAEQVPAGRSPKESVQRAAEVIRAAAQGGDVRVEVFEEATAAAACECGLGVFAFKEASPLSDQAFAETARALLCPAGDASIDVILFQSMPMWWLGCVYQGLLAYRPSRSGERLETDLTHRKGAGVFFTPPCLVDYIVDSVLSPLADSAFGKLDGGSALERLSEIRVLDPAMGGGDFLSRTVEFLCGTVPGCSNGAAQGLRADIAASCVYGVDIDPVVVEVARLSVWAASGYSDGISDALNSHLVCADALGSGGGVGAFDWSEAFPGVFAREAGRAGFDAVLGNPPYVASKNGLDVGAGRGGRGQSDSYLMFLSSAMENSLVRPGGALAMVLPDPMLVRENAAEVRRRLANDWTITSLLHIYGAFPGAVVANIVPICRNVRGGAASFPASRIELAADRHSFLLRPQRTARELAQTVRLATVLSQERCEFLYLLEDGPFGEVVRRIHGEDACLSHYEPPFAPLGGMNISAIYRGEEVGKAVIRGETGDLPMLLGGQSVQPYEITWEGRRTDRSHVHKAVGRYLRTKILIQKSSAHVVAALDEVRSDHPGYVFPQSVYAVELAPNGMHEIYLLCLLNSQVIDEYIRRTVSGYKMLQPQLELEDIRGLPIRRIDFSLDAVERGEGLESAMALFEDESRRAGDGAFPELANMAAGCLAGETDRSAVVHDVLVRLGRIVIDLTSTSRRFPDSEMIGRLVCARAAIEAIVWRLYSSQPDQMHLPW